MEPQNTATIQAALVQRGIKQRKNTSCNSTLEEEAGGFITHPDIEPTEFGSVNQPHTEKGEKQKLTATRGLGTQKQQYQMAHLLLLQRASSH